MKANELMIGDWVCHCKRKHEPMRITNLAEDFTDKDMEGIEPIPLTPEILEKNGFSENYREDDLSYAQSCGDVIGIHIFWKGGIMDEMYFKYVHELQHAFKLCGIEKEIVL